MATTDVTAWRKGTRSGSGNNSDCVEVRRAWRKSTRSGAGNDSSCVEVAMCSEEGFHVRDSKLGGASPVFDLDAAGYASLIRAARH
jgi:hypothetical protein